MTQPPGRDGEGDRPPPALRARIPSLLASAGALVVAALLWRAGQTVMATLFGAAAILLAVLTLRLSRPGAGDGAPRGPDADAREGPGRTTVYDKADHHDDTVMELGLPSEHAANHTVFFLRWLIERSLVGASFESESADVLRAYRDGRATIHDVYEWWDSSLGDDMLSDEGNAFARSYFDFDHGQYLQDYRRVLQRDLPSEYHVPYAEESYQALRAVVDARYEAWRQARGAE